MKYLNLILASFLLFSCSGEEQEVVIDYWTTQEELNSFQNELKDIVRYDGDINIGHEIYDLESLHHLKEIYGTLTFQNSKIEYLELPNLEQVEKLEIRGNAQLKKISFTNLQQINDNLLIAWNSGLENIEMNNLEKVENDGIDIVDNDSLKFIKLQELDTYSTLNFRLNPILQQININRSISEKCEKVLIEFDLISSNSILFDRSETFCEVKIEISKTNESTLAWLSNFDGDNVLNNTTLIGDFEFEQFCFLKNELTQMIHPENFNIRKSEYEAFFNGSQIIQNCN